MLSIEPGVVLLLAACLHIVLMQHTRYVLPDGLSPQACPNNGHLCLTLDQYATQQRSHFTDGASFVFLAGNHTPQVMVNLSSINNLTLKGESSEEGVYVICRNFVTILCNNMTTLSISRLTFVLDFVEESSVTQSAVTLWGSRGVLLSDSRFVGMAERKGTFVVTRHSDVWVRNCLFEGNVGMYGGALFAYDRSTVTLEGSVFTQNKATYYGGAILALQSSIVLLGGLFTNNLADCGGAICFINGTFFVQKYSHHFPRAVDTEQEQLNFTNNVASRGGAVALLHSNATLTQLAIMFLGNSADNGSAVFSEGSRVTFDTKSLRFVENRASNTGGAIFSRAHSTITITGSSMKAADGVRAGLQQNATSKMVLFARNYATRGGGLYLESTTLLFEGVSVDIMQNSAEKNGGGICSVTSRLYLRAVVLSFVGNTAGLGGGIWSQDDVGIWVSRAEFESNSARSGAAIYFHHQREAVLQNVSVTGHVKTALFVFDSNLTFTGTADISRNGGPRTATGAGMYITRSVVSFTGHSLLEDNVATLGGAIVTFHSQISFVGITVFSQNRAFSQKSVTAGGGIYALETHILVLGTLAFTFNKADYGGAMFFSSGTKLTLEACSTLRTSHNHASQYGGSIYVEDTPTASQCLTEASGIQQFDTTPSCFLDIKGVIPNVSTMPSIVSQNDSTGDDGSFLYGGLLDRCRIDSLRDAYNQTSPLRLLKSTVLHIERVSGGSKATSSRPYQLCFCQSDQHYDCTSIRYVSIVSGQEINVSLLAVGQGGVAVPTRLTAIVGETARLSPLQSIQSLPPTCTQVTYNIFSSKDSERVVVFPDGPCRDQTAAKMNVTIKPCPNAFVLQGQDCICEKRLQEYDVECVVDDVPYVVRKAGSRVWMSAIYEDNGTYQGLVLFARCPTGYCREDEAIVSFSFGELDGQCSLHRSAVLCGACAANHSLSFGGPRCEVCSDAHLALLLPLAAAGIALVVFLSLLRLTVAMGVVNSIILYANIIQANRTLFSLNSTDVLTVFVSWWNLDLGIQTCFYHGMDGYAQTWLQFAFPLYVWLLISLIIITSRYSITLSKLVGSNPIAVLATLLLMSYNKVLKIIIEVYSAVKLDYPNNRTVTVWLKDANVAYLESKHLLLTVVTSLMVIFLFLPYTLLLLLGHRFYRISSRRHLRWLNRLKPLLDSYHAPYKTHTRYWTGLLLLVRCALYIVFSFNSLGATAKSLLAIIITFTAILILAWLSVRIYKSIYANVVEVVVYLNLITLSAATLAGASSPALVYTLVGVVFVIMLVTIVQQLYLVCIAKSAIWLWTKGRGVKIMESFKSLGIKKAVDHPMTTPHTGYSSHDQHRIVTKTVIDLRETLLEDDHPPS